jgi:hypothetical protein
MQFDNKNRVLKLNMRRYIVLLLFTTIIGLLIFTRLLDNILGITKTTALLITVVAYLIYVLITFIINYQYIFYSDVGDKIILKYVSLRPFDNKRKAIEISKENYYGYKIRKSFFNLKEEIILLIQTPNGIAKYPPISIAALTPKQKKILIHSIQKL